MLSQRQRKDSCIRRSLRTVSVASGLLVLFSLSVSAQNDPLVYRTEFEMQLALPGSDDFLRPGQVFFDPSAGEVYVVDQGHNRIVIFDRRGVYRFEFSPAAYCGSVNDLVVTSNGEIILLGSTDEGLKALRFDFDGRYLGGVDVRPPQDGLPVKLTTLSTDSRDRIYILDESAGRVLRLSSDLTFDAEFPVLGDVDDKSRHEAAYGLLRVAGDELLLPISSLGTVYRYSLDGEFRGTIGYQGSAPGEMTFPTAATVTADGMILVLDKQRFMVLCYAPDGRFLGEFGGMGTSPGWFYFPTWITVDAEDRIYISQVFLNRVQVCRIPEAIRTRLIPARQLGGVRDLDGGAGHFLPVDANFDNINIPYTNHVILTHKTMEVQHA